MKKILVILALLLFGCATTTTFNHHKAPDVYIDTDYTWVNNDTIGVMFGARSGVRSITIRVINKKYVDVKVKVQCDFSDGAIFGYSEKTVEARNDNIFMVYGFARLVPNNETISCSIKSIR